MHNPRRRRTRTSLQLTLVGASASTGEYWLKEKVLKLQDALARCCTGCRHAYYGTRHTVLWEGIRTTHKPSESPMGHVPMGTTDAWRSAASTTPPASWPSTKKPDIDHSKMSVVQWLQSSRPCDLKNSGYEHFNKGMKRNGFTNIDGDGVTAVTLIK